MHPVLVIALFAAVLQPLAAQVLDPRSHLYRGPLYMTREVAVVEPGSGLPLGFHDSSLLYGFELRTTIQSRTVRTIPVSGITLRVAFGPTAEGMITFRVRTGSWPLTLDRITPNSSLPLVRFAIVPEDPVPGALALKPHMKIVFTLERMEADDGTMLFENPDATELLWIALGRPVPRS
jgi:hypothetical protein